MEEDECEDSEDTRSQVERIVRDDDEGSETTYCVLVIAKYDSKMYALVADEVDFITLGLNEFEARAFEYVQADDGNLLLDIPDDILANKIALALGEIIANHDSSPEPPSAPEA